MTQSDIIFRCDVDGEIEIDYTELSTVFPGNLLDAGKQLQAFCSANGLNMYMDADRRRIRFVDAERDKAKRPNQR